MKNNSTISSNKFFLGEGEDGIYSNITIEIKKSEQATINRGANIQLQDEEILRAIEKEFKTNWIERYKKDEIYLEIMILNVGIDPTGRKYKVDNSVGGVMHDALPKIGIQPPQIFGL
ncbi:hypothetical protein ACIVBQ_000601 [Tenacibaculum discolor]